MPANSRPAATQIISFQPAEFTHVIAEAGLLPPTPGLSMHSSSSHGTSCSLLCVAGPTSVRNTLSNFQNVQIEVLLTNLGRKRLLFDDVQPRLVAVKGPWCDPRPHNPGVIQT